MLVPPWIRRRTLRKRLITECADKNKTFVGYLNHLQFIYCILYYIIGRRVRIITEGNRSQSLTTDIRLQFGMVSRERFRCSGSFGLD